MASSANAAGECCSQTAEIPLRNENTSRARLSEWHTLVVALPGALVTGFIYAYPTYSNALQEAFKDDIKQGEKELIGIAPVLCNLITFSAGIIMDKTSVWFCCILGGLIMMCSYGLFGAIALKYITVSHPVGVFFCLNAAGSYGCSFMVAATFTVLTKNFHADWRSSIISIAKSWVGVSTGVGTAIFCGFVHSKDTDRERLYFLFFVAAVTGSIPILISPFLRPVTPGRAPLSDQLLCPISRRLPICYFLSVVLIVTTLVSTFVKNSATISIILIVLLLLPFALITPRHFTGSSRSARAAALISPVEHPSPTVPARSISLRSSPWECGPWEMVQKPEFVLIFLCTLFLQSGGLFLTTNIGSMVQARSGPAVSSATAATIFSCSQGFARLVTGNTSSLLLYWNLPRTVYFPMMMMVMAAGHAVLCIPGPMAMFAGTALSGWAFGSVYPLLVLVVGEVFGSKRVASNYMMFDGMPGAFGALIFAKFLANLVYQAHEGPDGTCHGDACFRLAHVIMIGASLVGVLLGFILSIRTRAVYSKMLGLDNVVGDCGGSS